MSAPVGKVVSRDVRFENFLKEQANSQAKKYTAPIKDDLGAYSDATIEKAASYSKDSSRNTSPVSVANIMTDSVDAAKSSSKKATRILINTCTDLTVSAAVDKAVNWMKKH